MSLQEKGGTSPLGCSGQDAEREVTQFNFYFSKHFVLIFTNLAAGKRHYSLICACVCSTKTIH